MFPSDSGIPFRGALTEPIYVAAQLRAIRRRGAFRILVVVLLLLSMAVFLLPNKDLLEKVVLAALLLLMIPVCPWAVKRSLRQRYRRVAAYLRPFEGLVAVEKVTITEASGESRIPWRDFSAVIVDEDLVLLFRNPEMMHILHPGFFASVADWETAKRVIREARSAPGRSR